MTNPHYVSDAERKLAEIMIAGIVRREGDSDDAKLGLALMLREAHATIAALLAAIDSRPANDQAYGKWAYDLHELAAEIRGGK